jgi:uncharacterized membrane protein
MMVERVVTILIVAFVAVTLVAVAFVAVTLVAVAFVAVTLVGVACSIHRRRTPKNNS